MNVNCVSTEDMEYFTTQTTKSINMILAGMTALLDENNENAAVLEFQIWFQRMSNAITGKNKMTQAEIQQNRDKINSYISQVMLELFERNCIDSQIVTSLGICMNKLCANNTQPEACLRTVAEKLKQRMAGIDNFSVFETEVEKGTYNSLMPISAMCKALSHLDICILNDDEKLGIIEKSLMDHGIISGESMAVSSYLMDLLNTDDKEIAAIYIEMEITGGNFIADIFKGIIEHYHFLPKTARIMKKKELVVENIMQQNQLDASAELSLEDIYHDFLDAKKMEAFRIDAGASNAVETVVYDTELQQGIKAFLDLAFDDAVNLLEQNEDGLSLYLMSFLRDMASGYTDKAKSTECLERGYLTGNVLATVRYARRCSSREKTDAIIQENIEDLKDLAMQGNMFAQYEYAVLCSEAYDYDINKEGVDVRALLQQSSDQGFWMAKQQLARCYCYGIDGEADCGKAFRLFNDLDKLDMPLATMELARFYLNGIFVEENEQKAAKLYEKAAKWGCIEAKRQLARCYQYGWGVVKDREKAEEMFAELMAGELFMIPMKAMEDMEAEFDLKDLMVLFEPNRNKALASYNAYCLGLESNNSGRDLAVIYLLASAMYGYPQALYDCAKYSIVKDADNYLFEKDIDDYLELFENEGSFICKLPYIAQYIPYNIETAKYCLEKAKNYTDDEELLSNIDWLELKITCREIGSELNQALEALDEMLEDW